MNNTNEISQGVRFHVDTKNIKTSEDGTTIEIVDHELLIENLPEDNTPPLNENMLTVDAFNRVYKKEISSLPSPTPPIINTITDDILEPNNILTIDSDNVINKSLAFSNVDGDMITQGDIQAGKSSSLTGDIALKASDTHTSLACYNETDVNPYFSVTKSGPRNPFLNGSINLGAYEDQTGKLIMTDTFGLSIFKWGNSSFFSPLLGAIGTEDPFPALNIELRGGPPGSNYTIFKCLLFLGEQIATNTSLTHVCGLNSASNSAVEKVSRADIFGQDLLTSSNVTFNVVTCETPLLNVEFTAQYVIIKEGNDQLKKVLLIDLFEQNLNPISNVRFNNLTANGDVIFSSLPFISSTNNFVTVDGLGNINKTIVTNITASGDIVTAGSINCSSLTTGQGFNNLYPMNQDVLTTSNVTFNNIFSNGLIQTDQILENTLNNGVDVTSWNIKTQSITSDALSSAEDPLRVSLNFTSDADSLIELYATSHDNCGILLDMRSGNFGGATDNDFISSSVNGNVFINKSAGDLNFLFQNSTSKGSFVAKNTMNNVFSLSKTSVSIREPLTCEESVVLSNIPTDPETQPETILITQSSITDELFKRPYQSVFGSAVNNASPLIVALPIINTYVRPVLNYAFTFQNNMLAISDNIGPIAGMDTALYSVSYSVSYASNTNTLISYSFGINISGFFQTASLQTTIIKSADERHNVSCTFVASLVALDGLALVVKNTLTTDSITIYDCALTVNKIFQ